MTERQPRQNREKNMTAELLHERQQWTLAQKLDHSLATIDQFLAKTDGKVFLAFSGGKDSTVLMHLCEILKKDIPCVFVNTGCEHPDIVRFVNECKEEHNIITLRPKSRPKDVWAKVRLSVGVERDRRERTCSPYQPELNQIKKALGILNPDSQFVLNKQWRYLINEPYDTSNKCCTILKKNPSHQFQKETGLFPILGIMASESRLREKTYISRGGCNVWGDNANSHPLSIWTDDDIWQFIRENNIKIADIYNKGAQRTGCVACGFGCQFKNDTRLQLLYQTYPKYYELIMNFENHGVKYRTALRKMLAMNGLLLPDEKLF